MYEGRWLKSRAMVVFCLLACSSNERRPSESRVAPEQPPLERAAASDADRPAPYPPGSWRAAPEQLDQTLLWVSHLLIRHEEVEDTDVSFDLTGWLTAQPPVRRSRQDALRLARELAETARRQGNFPELARRFSEEPETSARGGSLGGIAAGQLSLWPQVLDALQTLEPGGVSNVVSTGHGYHVFHRRPAPAETTVSGAHIVIAHAAAPWSKFTARAATVPERSREQALALAADIVERARANPESFGQLVAEYSDHRDALRGGDFGTWSTHEPAAFPREIETLVGLEVGDVAEPIDTRFGIQIIQRTENRPRMRYAMKKIQLRFDTEHAPAHPFSKPSAFKQARELAKALSHEPARFDAVAAQSCCTGVLEVIEGRGLPALEVTLAGMQVGEVASEPVEDVEVEYLIPRRLSPDTLPPTPPVRFELPSAAEPAR